MLMGDNSGILTFFDFDADISIQLELSKYHRGDSDVTPIHWSYFIMTTKL